MARARWIKPEFFTDGKVCQVDDQAALVFEALWVESDDGGVAPGDARDIYGRRFLKRERHGWSVDAVTKALAALEAVELALPFIHRGERFVLIPEFARKQGIKPKLWRHLGNAHDEITAAVLLRRNGGGDRSNAGGAEANAGSLPQVGVSLPFTPKPLAVAVAVANSQSHKPEPQPGRRSAAARETWNELIAQIPDDYREALEGLIRGAQDPEAVMMSIRAAGPGGVNQCAPSWEIVGRAVLEIRAAGGGFTPLRLAAFCRRLQEKPPVRDGGAGTRGYEGTAFREANGND